MDLMTPSRRLLQRLREEGSMVENVGSGIQEVLKYLENRIIGLWFLGYVGGRVSRGTCKHASQGFLM